MLIYNTYTRQKEEFKPIEENKVKMYICGPTVYNYVHIGNARPVLFFDLVHRYFNYLGYEVDYVSNVTDVDDKIINRAIEEEVTEAEIAKKYLEYFLECNQLLNALPFNKMPKVTENMEEMIDFIHALVERGYAYAVEGDVYFRIDKVREYGQLSGKRIEELEVGARIAEDSKKENPLDFVLWKKTDKGITWDSPWGAGRPGWHTECVVMIQKEFKGKIDIHGGGTDLQFPHHENEIAQSLCMHGHSIANYWMHVGRLGLNNEKMSKSLGNVINVKDLIEKIDANAFRLFMLSVHYRQPINYTEENIQLAMKEWQKIKTTFNQLHLKLDVAEALDVKEEKVDAIAALMQQFTDALEDDFNTSNAITSLYGVVKEVNKMMRAKVSEGAYKYALMTLQNMTYIFGFDLKKKRLTSEERDLFKSWEAARKAKDFTQADALRERLQALNVI
ncbi:MAG: cysteine--tRNA ligase [Turicibacter sp.]|jgi:cysteinyl-tRNA synthetase|uniref:Cysteine--tRNA ligase n=1 Tax=Turicibacter faecis TaxID=2963365 RepID=A0ABN6Z8V6_9FIRM|nr:MULTISPECIES: cysteine--tRNA ligase [unclassified Turicibacter]MBC9723353.1 cysteine--tRNA ligase [Lactobacillus sp.]MCI8701066.1 cysteine--tRNA ligase [Turicibacter sp.]BEH89946.1 cysteine--tRNA ligase [Turicibacter sp. TC023]MCU7203646.1 cysteine--tRNA ligase [Turicibacter sp. TA25]MCU7209000.1 cysteine--tRNA ligase [Turicibacter sp. 1E2]